MNNKYFNIKQASELLGVSKLTLRNWDKQGKLVAHRHPVNNYRVYKKEDLEALISQMENSKIHPRARVIHNAQEEKPKVFKLKVTSLKD